MLSRLDNLAAAGNPTDAQKHAQSFYVGAGTIPDANAAFSQAWAAYVDSAWQCRWADRPAWTGP